MFQICSKIVAWKPLTPKGEKDWHFTVHFVSRLLCDYPTASCKIIFVCFSVSTAYRSSARLARFFLSETECKGNAFFWATKTFQKKIQSLLRLSFDLQQHSVFLESGCKSRHFFITIQIFSNIFYAVKHKNFDMYSFSSVYKMIYFQKKWLMNWTMAILFKFSLKRLQFISSIKNAQKLFFLKKLSLKRKKTSYLTEHNYNL